MAAVRSGEVERASHHHNMKRHSVALFYGPDAGMVSERAKRLAHAAVDDPADPFQLVRMDGDAVAADPGRLADEAGTMGLFGARRCLWIRPSRSSIASAIAVCLELDLTNTTVVIEAGDLAKTAPLRVACETSPKAMAYPCYADRAEDLEMLVDAALGEAGLSVGHAERAHLLQSLGGDRLASRGELAKLILYMHGHGEVALADIDAVISDVAGSDVSEAVDAAFSGRLAQVDEACQRASAKSGGAAVVLGNAIRHTLALMGGVRAGNIDQTLSRWRGLHFSRKDDVRRHLGLWSEPDLCTVLERLQAAVLDTRQHARLAEPLAARALMDIARQAQNRLRRR